MQNELNNVCLFVNTTSNSIKTNRPIEDLITAFHTDTDRIEQIFKERQNEIQPDHYKKLLDLYISRVQNIVNGVYEKTKEQPEEIKTLRELACRMKEVINWYIYKTETQSIQVTLFYDVILPL